MTETDQPSPAAADAVPDRVLRSRRRARNPARRQGARQRPVRLAGLRIPRRATPRVVPVRRSASAGGPWADFSAPTFRHWLDALPRQVPGAALERFLLFGITAFGLLHVIGAVDFAHPQRDLGVLFLLGVALLAAIGLGVRFCGPLVVLYALLVGLQERIHRQPYTGTDVRAATAEAIRVLRDHGNPYAHTFLDTNPPGSPFAYPIGEPLFYWLHQFVFDRIDLADKVSGMLILVLLAALAPLVGTVRAALVTMLYGTYAQAAQFSVDGSNDTSFAFLVVLAMTLLVYSQWERVPPGTRAVLFILSALFFGWAILFKQFAWFIYPFVALALRQRRERWRLHAVIAVGGAIVVMLPFFLNDPAGVVHNLGRSGITNDIWGLNVWNILTSFAPGIATLRPYITLPSLVLALAVLVVQLPWTTADPGGAVLRGLLAIGTLLVTAVWTTYPYYTGMAAILAVAVACSGAPALARPAVYPLTWASLLPAPVTAGMRRLSVALWGRPDDAAR